MDFKFTRGNPDVYTLPQTKPDGFRYYEMILVYVDDIVMISHDTNSIIFQKADSVRLNEDSLDPPSCCLGAAIKVYTDRDRVECWVMSSDEYVKAAVVKVERDLEKEELDDDGVAKYQGYMGVFHQMIELGQIDILTKASYLAFHQALPCEGHLEACYSTFAYLRKHLTMATFKDADWVNFYGDVTEEIPDDMPKPLGNSVQMKAWFYSDHTGNLVTSAKNTVETSTFGAEFIVGHTCLEAVEDLHFKLRVFGIPIDGPAHAMYNNSSVVNSDQHPESTLNKKHLSICLHMIRETCVAGIIYVGKIESKKSLSDFFTKLLPTGA
eukprot:10399500-Ditylum_brightwellii.AAC.1